MNILLAVKIMAIFIDTGAFIAARNEDDQNFELGSKVIDQISDGVYGKAYTSDYIFDEAIVFAITRTKRHDITRDLGTFILDFPDIILLFTPETIFHKAWKIHDEYANKSLSFTDCTIIAWCQLLKIDKVASFDAHFDGILTRITS